MGDPGCIPLCRVTLTIYRMALHFEVAISFAGRKMERRERIGKRKGRAERGVFVLKNGMIEEVKHTGLKFRDIAMICRK
jgi:hypothetical protein